MMFENEILVPLQECINKYSNKNAFFIDGTFYTYQQFAERISAIRAAIRATKNNEQICGLALHDDLDTYASIFALWMEGKCYVPLHPSWPDDRIQNIVEQIGCTYILDSNLNRKYEKRCSVIETNKCESEDFISEKWKEVSENNLAYILFTSGSTGVPKGVQLSRRNLATFMDSFWKTGIKIDETDRCMQIFDLTFDVSVQSYLVALTRGACVYTVPYGQVKYLYAASLIQEKRITFGAMAPSMLTYLRPYFGEFDASSIKTCILTAEACPVDLMEEWYNCAKNAEIYDFYGPTEATIYCTYYKLTRCGKNLSLNGTVSIGKPLVNVQAIIIDENGNIVPEKSGAEHKGELCVAGNQVTPGYWKNDEKNANSFFVRDGARYYHTGDLTYWDESGNIMYSGRIDQQAKIQGFRVELGEIEYYAREFFKKEYRVVAIAFQNSRNLTEIALFVESKKEDSKLMLEYLSSKMPSYMIPKHVIYMPTFPLNKSEKIDRNALKMELNNIK